MSEEKLSPEVKAIQKTFVTQLILVSILEAIGFTAIIVCWFLGILPEKYFSIALMG